MVFGVYGGRLGDKEFGVTSGLRKQRSEGVAHKPWRVGGEAMEVWLEQCKIREMGISKNLNLVEGEEEKERRKGERFEGEEEEEEAYILWLRTYIYLINDVNVNIR